ncbi:hypothetical protein PN462_01095 [Spirulina sp. CS-785/01]|uniref:hypothetical protein n=1 Tax=Spirulina sp. CS-785/01 TaxID=3021716 RepID=UPI00232D9459|nr:hypothetical protein [Spirulina sp. CS-785/01]MDB9311679.1 hypothetical protein [Spirulina sp. CS-785/01]
MTNVAFPSFENSPLIIGNVPIQKPDFSGVEFAGVFQDDADFAAIMDSIYAKRNSEDDSEVDPDYFY